MAERVGADPGVPSDGGVGSGVGSGVGPGADVLLVRVGTAPQRSRGADTTGTPGRDPGGKRAAIVRAATELFLQQGYSATRTEQIAAAAAVSKQTVYKQFGDKEQLFRAIVDGITASVEQFTAELAGTFTDLHTTEDLDDALPEFARRYIRFTITAQVIAVRRLVIGEASRFPELARDYYRRAPRYFLGAVADWLAGLAERGLLDIEDPQLAADQFGFTVLGQALDEATFCGPTRTTDDLERIATRGAEVFLRAHRSGRRDR